MTDDARQLLKRVRLFAELDDREQAEIAAVVKVRTCRRGEVVLQQADQNGDLFTVVDGHLKIGWKGGNDTEVVFSIAGPGEIFGEFGLIDSEPRTSNVVALEACRLLVIPRADFLALVKRTPVLALGLIEYLAREIRQLRGNAQAAGTLATGGRLAKTLTDLAQRFGSPEPRGIRINLRLSQQELGAMVGASRESVNKWLREFVRRRLVRRANGRLVIDQRRLRLIVESPERNAHAADRQRHATIGAHSGASVSGRPKAASRRVAKVVTSSGERRTRSN